MKYITKVNLMIGFLLLAIAGSLAYGLSERLQPVEKLTLVDSRGKLVGNVIGTDIFGGSANVAFRLDGKFFVFAAQKNGFLDYPGLLFFQSANCTGTPYGGVPLESNYLATAYAISGGKVYEPSGPIVSGIFNSYLDTNLVCTPSESQQDLVPLQFTFDLNREFSPPFKFKSTRGADER